MDEGCVGSCGSSSGCWRGRIGGYGRFRGCRVYGMYLFVPLVVGSPARQDNVALNGLPLISRWYTDRYITSIHPRSYSVHTSIPEIPRWNLHFTQQRPKTEGTYTHLERRIRSIQSTRSNYDDEKKRKREDGSNTYVTCFGELGIHGGSFDDCCFCSSCPWDHSYAKEGNTAQKGNYAKADGEWGRVMIFLWYECNDPIRTRCTSTGTRGVRVYLYL